MLARHEVEKGQHFYTWNTWSIDHPQKDKNCMCDHKLWFMCATILIKEIGGSFKIGMQEQQRGKLLIND